MRIRDQWRRRGLGRALSIGTAVVALLLLVLFLVLMLRGHSPPAGAPSGGSPAADSVTP